MAEIPPVCDFGWKAPSFRLQGTDGVWHTLEDLQGLIPKAVNIDPFDRMIFAAG